MEELCKKIEEKGYGKVKEYKLLLMRQSLKDHSKT